MILKVAGKANIAKINALCTAEYGCKHGEVNFSLDFAVNPYVEIKHTRPVNGGVSIFIPSDNMSVLAVLYPPINGGGMLSLENAINSAASSAKLRKDIFDHKAFNDAYNLAKSGVIVYGAVIAVGKHPIHGVDGALKLFFNLPSSKPKVEEGGKAYFRELQTFVNVSKGALLARITPATVGFPGLTVTGETIPQVPGKFAEVKAGEGVRTEKNATEFFADRDGHVTYKNGLISVSGEIVVNGNVDYNTGNILFTGVVRVEGDVLAGFTVKGSDIIIEGIVNDATIVAENDVVINTGVKARQKYFISAGRDIRVGYAENANLTAKNNIYINKYAYNCLLNAGEKVVAEEKTTVAGGEINLFSGGVFYNIGTKANNHIAIKLGKKYYLDEKLARITAEKERLQTSLVRIEEVLAPINLFDEAVIKNQKIQKLVEMQELIKRRVDLFTRRIDSIMRESLCQNPTLTVNNEVQEGIKIFFYSQEYEVRTLLRKVNFFYDAANLTVDYKTL